MVQREVIEVIEYIDDSDWDGDDSDFEEVVEIVEQVVNRPRKTLAAVAPHEVGIGTPPPLFLTPQEKTKLAREQERKEAVSKPVDTYRHQAEPTNRKQQELPSYIPATTWQGTKPGYYFGTTTEKGTGYHLDAYQKNNPALQQQLQQTAPPSYKAATPKVRAASPPTSRSPTIISKRLSMKKSIINQAIGIDEDDDLFDEEIIEEEIIEEEYYDEDEVIEDEYEEEEYEEEYIIEEVVHDESPEEAKARQALEAEIAEIERQIAAAKAAKEERFAAGFAAEETTKEKAQRMAASSRLQACKQMKVESEFKRKAAARAKILAEREKTWENKGKTKQKDLAEIIASKAKKQQKLVSRAKARDAEKKKNPPPPKEVEAPKVAAPAAEEPELKEHKQLSMMEMLAQKAQKGAKGMEMGKVKALQEVKSAAADDFGDDDLHAEDFFPSSDEDEEEDAEPELTPEQQHQKSLEWAKPSWTQAKLKTTTKGNKIKQGKTISAPITFIPKKINEGLEEEEDNGAPSKGALMKGAVAMVQLPKTKKHQAGLKFTGNGARIRDGRKIEKPIMMKAQNKEEVKIWGADPEELKLTPRGLNARKGKVLSEEITQATQKKKYAFEKPAWAKTKPSHLLKTTDVGEQLKEGEDIAPVITDTHELQKKHAFEKPSWTQAKLKTTEEGKKVKEGAYLSAPIVNLNKKTLNVNMEANPAFLRMTEQGEKLMEEGNLEGPITAAPALAKRHDG